MTCNKRAVTTRVNRNATLQRKEMEIATFKLIAPGNTLKAVGQVLATAKRI
jgi:hypothetical protein